MGEKDRIVNFFFFICGLIYLQELYILEYLYKKFPPTLSSSRETIFHKKGL